jgi:hypothetical protein
MVDSTNAATPWSYGMGRKPSRILSPLWLSRRFSHVKCRASPGLIPREAALYL